MTQASEVMRFNERWAYHGMSGLGVDSIWENWGAGGHPIHPEVYVNSVLTPDHPVCAKEETCSQCKQCKPRVAFSRYEWNKRVRWNGFHHQLLFYDHHAPHKAVCIDCAIMNQKDQCNCKLNLEVWELCSECIARAAPISARVSSRPTICKPAIDSRWFQRT